MNIGSFIFSLEIVEKCKNKGDSLNGGVLIFFAESIEKREDENRPKILDIEDMFPSNLPPQIFQIQATLRNINKLNINLIIRQHNLLLSIFI